MAPKLTTERVPASLSKEPGPVVCSLTINSDNEVRVFRAHMKDFRFVELFQDAESSHKETFHCDPSLECDVVLISGNFAGRFQGAHGSLSLEELEAKSCQQDCSGVFAHPKEVFLMGCNTLATKAPDRRTIEEYLQALAKDQVPTRLAQRVAAYRYSEFGQGFGDRLRQIFKNPETHIYGFDSIAPSGHSVEPLLKNYFSSVGDYQTHLNHLSPHINNSHLAKALKDTALVERRGGGDPGAACLMVSRDRITEKINFIDNVLWDKDQALKYLPLVLEYRNALLRNGGDRMSEAEASYWERLQTRMDVKNQVLQFYEKLTRSLPLVRLDLLQFSYEMSWITNQQFRDYLSRDFGYGIGNDLKVETARQFCEDKVRINLRASELPTPPWSRSLTRLIGCSGTNDVNVRVYLNKMVLEDWDPSVALFALGQLWPMDIVNHLEILLTSQSPQRVAAAISVLKFVNLRNLKMGPQRVFDLLAQHEPYIEDVENWSRDIPWSYRESEGLLTQLISSKSSRHRRVVLWVLQHKPDWVTNRREILGRFSNDPDPVVRAMAISQGGG